MFRIKVSHVPLRSEGSHRSESISELLFGEAVELISEKNDWVEVRGLHDGYSGWIERRTLMAVDWPETTTLTKAMTPVQFWPNSGEKPQILWLSAGSLVPYPAKLSENEHVFFIPEGLCKYRMGGAKQTLSLLEAVGCYAATPYLWGGRSTFGIDCSGLTQMIYRLVFNAALRRDAWMQHQDCKTIDFEDRQAGDLVFFAEATRVSHVGILLSAGTVFHASYQVRMDTLDATGLINRHTGEHSTLKIVGIGRPYLV